MMRLTRRHLWYGLPLLTAGIGGIGFYDILRRMQAGTYNAHKLPSPLLGRHPPDFTLPGLNGKAGFSQADLMQSPRPLLVNWFASWCAPCRQEAPVLQQLAASGVPVWGIAYRDQPALISAYLQTYGNPYQRLAVDRSGMTAINWGVYGVPETYFIDKTGIIRLRFAGALNEKILAREFAPLFERYS